jgi:hypothetical protein
MCRQILHMVPAAWQRGDACNWLPVLGHLALGVVDGPTGAEVLESLEQRGGEITLGKRRDDDDDAFAGHLRTRANFKGGRDCCA